MESPILAFTNKRKHKIQVRNRVLKIQIQKCFGQNIKYDLVIVLTRQKKKKKSLVISKVPSYKFQVRHNFFHHFA